MNRHLLVVAALGALAVASPAFAQARTSISIIPLSGYVVPVGDFTEDNTNFQLRPKGGVFVGAAAELALNKSLSLTGQATRTFGATQSIEAELDTVGGTITFTSDMATTQFIAGILIRPLGRLPSGAPRTVYLEAGGGITLWSVSRGWQDPNDPQELDFNASQPMVFAGGGLSFPAGPRFSVQVFGRAHYMLTEYSSEGLDDVNGLLGSTIQGKKVLLIQLGLGLRVGR